METTIVFALDSVGLGRPDPQGVPGVHPPGWRLGWNRQPEIARLRRLTPWGPSPWPLPLAYLGLPHSMVSGNGTYMGPQEEREAGE